LPWGKSLSWNESNDYIKELSTGGYSDWRLPTIAELKTIYEPSKLNKDILGGEFEAHLLALACSEAPKGRKRWTVRLLAEKMIELKVVETVSPMTVCNTLKR
jgi:hypothetical protein